MRKNFLLVYFFIFLAFNSALASNSYTIYKDSSGYKAIDDDTGNIVETENNFARVENIINTIINNYLTSGGKILLKNGVYNLTQAIIIKDNIDLSGEGSDTILEYLIPVGNYMGALIDIRGVSGWKISNLKLTDRTNIISRLTGANAGNGIAVADGASNGVIENIWGDHLSQEIIHIMTSSATLPVSNIAIRNITFNYGSRNGIVVSFPNGLYTDGIKNITLDNITISTIYGLITDGFASSTGTGHGIYVCNVNNLNMKNVTIKNCYTVTGVFNGNGIYIDGYSKLLSNSFHDIDIEKCKNGIFIREADNLLFSDINISDISERGIFITDSKKVLFSDINISDTSDDGVVLLYSDLTFFDNLTCISGIQDKAFGIPIPQTDEIHYITDSHIASIYDTLGKCILSNTIVDQ